jgi:hypothetical protein
MNMSLPGRSAAQRRHNGVFTSNPQLLAARVCVPTTSCRAAAAEAGRHQMGPAASGLEPQFELPSTLEVQAGEVAQPLLITHTAFKEALIYGITDCL